MADYIYLLEHRLSAAQRKALQTVRDLARAKHLTVFLVGGAVRDLTSGSPVRDLDVAVQGNALELKAELEAAGAVIQGEFADAQSLFVSFPGSVRVEVSSTMSVTFAKPGVPTYTPDTILEDLKRRDFTANAMGLSLNEGSYGLLMDPTNGVADIENRELRLVSNYGFIEDPVRMVRAARLMGRWGWVLDAKTESRYETGKDEGYISALSERQRGYELEEILHEEDPLRVIQKLEHEGWLQVIAPGWTAAKVDEVGLEQLHQVMTQLQLQGIAPDAFASSFSLLTAKLTAKEIAGLKSSFVRPGFLTEIEGLEAKGKELASLITSKACALPSQTWKVLHATAPEVVLWVAYSSKTPAVQTKFKNFYTVWPQFRSKIPYSLLQEMRIVPGLPEYDGLIETLFFELMDDKLGTTEELKAFLEPYSPPAPPPPVNTRRARASKKDGKGKGRGKKAAVLDDVDPDADVDGDLEDDDLGDDLDEVLTGALDEDLAEEDVLDPSVDLDDDLGDEESDLDDDGNADDDGLDEEPVKSKGAKGKASAAPKRATRGSKD